MPTHTLTERDQQWLTHLQQADELGVSLKQYAEAYDLDVKDLYHHKRQLTKKGALSSPKETTSDFVAVQVAPSINEKAVCLRHPSGWVIECADWPPTQWLSSLFDSTSKA